MADESNDFLPACYERHLGEIARGWSDKKRGHGIQIVSFEAQPEVGVTTFATLGFSRHLLNQPEGQPIRQELLMSANKAHPDDAVAGFLLSLAEHVLGRRQALLRGEVVGPSSPVIQASTLNTVFIANPGFFSGLLADLAAEPEPIALAHVVPIAASEASLVRELGWRWFEEELERQNLDTWNLARTEQVMRVSPEG